MTPDQLSNAINEAERFLKLAYAARVKMKTFIRPESERAPEFSAAKRASMDLTRALSLMRKP